ncbi:MAG: Nramp family divalent metal transporter [Candidatus Latescibacteria bacterium]|nr:Nramp family divalent metal transporter [Candidatus Latescibacterota bacterium]
MADSNSLVSRFWRLVLLVGPGFYLIGYCIGTGSVVSMASAGSRYGMSLLWALFLSCLFSFILMEAFGRYTAVTGKTAIWSFKQFPFMGKPIALATLIGSVFVEIMSLIGIMGIVSDLISEWSKMFISSNGWNPILIAVVVIIGLYLLVWVGKYTFFEKVLVIFVGLIAVSFLMTMFIVIPSPVDIIRGSIPRIPNEANANMIIAAIVGSTIGASVFVVRSILVREKNWGIEHLKLQTIDTFFASFNMFIISMAVMVCAAGTLFLAKKPVEDPITMVVLLEPLAGRFATMIFITGTVAAGISSIIPVTLLAPMLIADYRGVHLNMKSPSFRILCALPLLFGLTVPLFHARPVLAMIISQSFQVFVLPIVILSIIYLINRKDIMGTYRAGFWLNTGCIAALIFSFVMSYQSVLGLAQFVKMLME